MSQTNEFLLEGRTAYPEAVRATRAFEADVQDHLKSAVAERKKWGPFDLERTTPSAGGEAASGCWISLTVKGRIGKEATWLDLGFWWGPPCAPNDAFVYASFYKEPQRLLDFAYDRSIPEVRDFKWGGRTILIVPMPEDMNPRPGLSVLLDILVRIM